MPLGKLPPMKFFCVLFHISSFYLYENFRRQKNLFSFNQFFDYKLVYSKCLHHFFLSVLFWFSAMAYTVYHTYMRDQQCWASLPGNMLFLQATLFFNSASVLLNILINWASNFAYVLLNTCKQHHTETLYIFTTFGFVSTPRSIYAVFTWIYFHFRLHFHYD